ncbi:uncharacterized protein LOC124434813 [Xenia sp. Carnegie-2017]|uniref:uncharacterized protein LOC124434813 n=1 Tax=Xenia sp. Carnegie-2017 TaxID=2897299 RepID=UPI001F03FEB2|nr:uncharacterized protein LOC124434813 [Xenia sp. Carnegie-2017]
MAEASCFKIVKDSDYKVEFDQKSEIVESDLNDFNTITGKHNESVSAMLGNNCELSDWFDDDCDFFTWEGDMKVAGSDENVFDDAIEPLRDNHFCSTNDSLDKDHLNYNYIKKLYDQGLISEDADLHEIYANGEDLTGKNIPVSSKCSEYAPSKIDDEHLSSSDNEKDNFVNKTEHVLLSNAQKLYKETFNHFSEEFDPKMSLRFGGKGCVNPGDKVSMVTTRSRRSSRGASGETTRNMTTNIKLHNGLKGTRLSNAGSVQKVKQLGRNRVRSSTSSSSYQLDDTSPISSPEAEVPCVSPVNTEEYINDEDLIALDTKELNRRVRHLQPRIVQQIKHRRRTLKNREYAKSCRQKKIDEASSLQRSNGDLEKELGSLQIELELALFQRDEWKNKFMNLLRMRTVNIQ